MLREFESVTDLGEFEIKIGNRIFRACISGRATICADMAAKLVFQGGASVLASRFRRKTPLLPAREDARPTNERPNTPV